MSFTLQSRNAKIKKIQRNGKVVKAVITTFRKDNRRAEGEQFVPSVWYATFFSPAAEFVESLEDGALISLTSSYIAKEPYEVDGETRWPNNPTVNVFACELADSQKGADTSSGAADSANQDEDEFPF